jgi:hypothetical protein
MIEIASQKRAASHQYGQLPKDFHVALGCAVLVTVLHTCALISEVTRGAEFSTLTTHTITYLFLVIELGLIFNVIGFLFRRAAGVWISLIALSGAGAGYVLWYMHSRQILDFLLSKSFYQSHPEALPPYPFGLVGATWLNLIVLLISGVLFIWEIKTLRRMLATQKTATTRAVVN